MSTANCRNCRSLRYAKSRAPEKIASAAEWNTSKWPTTVVKREGNETKKKRKFPKFHCRPGVHHMMFTPADIDTDFVPLSLSFFCSIEWKWRSMGTTYCSLLLHCHAEGERMTARWPDVGQDISRWIGNGATAIRYTVCNDWLFLRI